MALRLHRLTILHQSSSIVCPRRGPEANVILRSAARTTYSCVIAARASVMGRSWRTLTFLIGRRPLSAGRLHQKVRVHVLLLVQFDFCTQGGLATDTNPISIRIANLELHKAVKHLFWASEKLCLFLNGGSDVEHRGAGDP